MLDASWCGLPKEHETKYQFFVLEVQVEAADGSPMWWIPQKLPAKFHSLCVTSDLVER